MAASPGGGHPRPGVACAGSGPGPGRAPPAAGCGRRTVHPAGRRLRDHPGRAPAAEADPGAVAAMGERRRPRAFGSRGRRDAGRRRAARHDPAARPVARGRGLGDGGGAAQGLRARRLVARSRRAARSRASRRRLRRGLGGPGRRCVPALRGGPVPRLSAAVAAAARALPLAARPADLEPLPAAPDRRSLHRRLDGDARRRPVPRSLPLVRAAPAPRDGGGPRRGRPALAAGAARAAHLAVAALVAAAVGLCLV